MCSFLTHSSNLREIPQLSQSLLSIKKGFSKCSVWFFLAGVLAYFLFSGLIHCEYGKQIVSLYLQEPLVYCNTLSSLLLLSVFSVLCYCSLLSLSLQGTFSRPVVSVDLIVPWLWDRVGTHSVITWWSSQPWITGNRFGDSVKKRKEYIEIYWIFRWLLVTLCGISLTVSIMKEQRDIWLEEE